MPLDFWRVSMSGEPLADPVQLDRLTYTAVAFHLLDAARFPLLTRVSDYYNDAVFEPSELEALREELRALAGRDGVVPALIDLTSLALETGTQIEVIAD